MQCDIVKLVDMKEENTLGALSYTYGVQKWKGAADTLTHMETNTSTMRATSRNDVRNSPVEGRTAECPKVNEPVAP